MGNKASRIILLLLPAICVAADDEEKQALELEKVEVVGVTPLQGAGVPLHQIASNVQTVSGEELQSKQSLSLADYMNRYMGSVNINDVQNNPFQPDVQYRGFTASPLLGLPQGLSVYLNGVRFNEPFGDTVNWDLIPAGAIDQMALHPGSNPVFGLNSLGGAIAIRTKNGFSAPGHQLEVFGGSWDRHSEEISSGGNNGEFGYFLDLRNFGEQGWRDFSRSEVKQGLGSLSWRGEKSALDLTLAANDNDLKGNGAVPIQLFKESSKSVFTHPDQTITRLFLSSLEGSAWLTDDIELSGNIYYRQNRIRTFNGDDSDFEECELMPGMLCEDPGADEEIVFDADGEPVAAGGDVESATINTSQTHQRSHGGTLQVAFNNDVIGRVNRLVLGSSYDHGTINFESDTELGRLTGNRGVDGSGVLVEESRVRLHAKVKSYGLFFTDTFSITEALAVTAAGRYNHTEVVMRDRHGDELNGHHAFYRFNPSYGVTYSFMPEIGLYGSYSEASRAPTPMELSCADPDAPCKLPNAFISDPPLDQVVAKTWEGGFRGRVWNVNWNAGVFHTLNDDDIQFISSGELTSEGFFRNVGKTRRRGVEAGVNAAFDRWRFAVNYTYLDATFRDSFIVNSPNNPSADANGQIQVGKGDRIPGIPRHILKFSTDVDVLSKWTVGLDMLYNSNQVFRGDEANLNDKLGGYAVFNLRTEYRLNRYLTLFGKLDNIFDREYKTFGLYGEAEEVLGDGFDDSRFIGVGAPRAGWLGFRVTL
ncbi:MAG: TonB-dependent receptor [Pseudomonadota bacterium]